MDNTKVEITKTELRSLMFWAASGIERSNGGSYVRARDFIIKKSDLMWDNCHDYKHLKFGSKRRNN